MAGFAILFNVAEDYHGEFGFDTVTLAMGQENGVQTAVFLTQSSPITKIEYIYNSTLNTLVDVRGNINLQKEILREYKAFKIPIAQERTFHYCIPYLSMLPEQEIELEMHFFVLTKIEIAKEVITFGANDAYAVTIDGQVNEKIRYIPDGKSKLVSIKCLKPSADTYIVAKSEKGVVGSILAKDNRTIYNLDVRVVCIVENTPKKDTEIDQLIDEFKENKIEEFLNKKSLNQALIKTNIEIDKKYHIALTEDEIKDIFHRPNQQASNSNEYFEDTIFTKLLNKYQAAFEGSGEKFKRVILFLNHIEASSLIQDGTTWWINAKEIIIFKKGLNSKLTYAHEIGHALGLTHFFVEPDDIAFYMRQNEIVEELNEYLESTTQVIQSKHERIARNKQKISESKEEIEAIQLNENQGDLETASQLGSFEALMLAYEQGIATEAETLEELIKTCEQENTKLLQEINIIEDRRAFRREEKIKAEKQIELFKKNKYRFAYRNTFNIMDYSGSRIVFSRWQWEIMQNSIKEHNQSLS